MNKITLFIGLNDKDTKRQEITTGEARAILADRIAQKIGFGTVSLASGVYTHDNGETDIENTLRCEFYTENPAPVMDFARWAKARLNQESIAVEVSAPAVQFI